ncbi:anti-sigma factor domain-containing protein [Terrilactibacillus laevilacticus]|uniref:anti-sigma factor domain-containing protein n=1 Tax=Terrilactibacillus laevilacticus TaxID=1380157 RepID=UPI0011464569|nr:anti-sigma factor domain-containing protein [Terrilactibacillus laevilacticus]
MDLLLCNLISNRKHCPKKRGGRTLDQGIVVSKDGRCAVVLTKDGSFKSVKLKKTVNLSVGQRVLYDDLSLINMKRLMILFTISAMVVCLSLMMYLMMVKRMNTSEDTAAYVSIDAFPSLEISLNNKLNVIQTRSFNKEAEQLLNQMSDEDVSLKTFLPKLMSQMEKSNPVEKDPMFMVTTTLTHAASKSDVSKIRAHLLHTLETNRPKLVKLGYSDYQMRDASIEERKKAIGQHLSTGKYLFYLDALRNHHTITIDQVKNIPLQQLRSMGTPLEENQKDVQIKEKNDSSSFKLDQKYWMKYS